jgi:hypothetical protein
MFIFLVCASDVRGLTESGTPTSHEPILICIDAMYFIICKRDHMMKLADAGVCTQVSCESGEDYRASMTSMNADLHKYNYNLCSQGQSKQVVLTIIVKTLKFFELS